MNIFNSIKHFIKAVLLPISPSLLNKIQNFNKNYVYKLRLDKQLKKLPGNLANYYRNTNNNEIKNIISFIEKNGVHMIPYDFILKYKSEDIIVYYDDYEKYPYVIIGKNRVYFPQGIKKNEIQKAVTTALIEQHEEESPHRYLNENINFKFDDIAVFVGASEGIFCLSIIEEFRKVYLFEPNEQWIKPLTLTFAPYHNKVEIVQKFVSCIDEGNQVTLDNYFSQLGERINYIQADIEGNEGKLLYGAKRILSGNNIKISICCYHNQEDQDEFSAFLSRYGFKIQYSKGYMLLWMQVPLKKPYLRKGIIQAYKN